jgi:hypothetical protein
MTITYDNAVVYEISASHGTRWVCPLCGRHGPYTGSRATTQVDYLNTRHALLHRKPAVERSCGAGGNLTVWIDLDDIGWRVTQLPGTSGWMLEATCDRDAIAILGIYPTLPAIGRAIGVELTPVPDIVA